MTDFITLGKAAIGTIEPHDYQQQRLDELTERLLGEEFYVATGETLPSRCIDGRSPKDGFTDFTPNAAGGTETLLIADELTTQRFYDGDDDTSDDYARLIDFLQEHGCRCGGHVDDCVDSVASGCGANDKLPAIIQFIAEHDDVVRQAVEAIGVNVHDNFHQQIVSQARELKTKKRYANGADMLKVLQKKAGEKVVDALVGKHNEVVAVINMQPSTTLNRPALLQEFGEMYQAFNVDVWSFAEAARLIAPDNPEMLELAMAYYNLATAYVLGGQNLRLIVRR